MVKEFLKKMLYSLWVLNGYLGMRVGFAGQQKLTILITYYNPARFKHINHQIRNLLQCRFVERVIISNHNPEIKIEEFVGVADERLVLLNQTVRRGCGYRWSAAEQFSPAYLIVMDDDILLFPWQVRKLFVSLLSEENIPHGFAGMVQQADGSLQYHQREDLSVDYLCEIYALTARQLTQYMKLKDQLQVDERLTRSIETVADFVVVSRTGDIKPRIHHAGFLLRCPTFNQTGIAIHKDDSFLDTIHAVILALNSLSN